MTGQSKTSTKPYAHSTELDLKKYEPTKEQMKEMYYFIMLNRAFDDRIAKLYRQGKIIGAAYGSRGQEATSVGSTYALGPDDIVGPIIRNAGSIIVRGLPVKNFLSNFVGRSTTPTRGRDGNSHLGDLNMGVFAPISHLGSLISNIAGCALAFKMKNEPRVALTYIGDGGTSTAEFHEGMNMAAVMKLPFICIIENNNWAYSTPTQTQAMIKDFAIKGKAYGMEAIVVDGNDVFEVFRTTRYAAERCRKGKGPILIEAKTMRMKGHAEHDDAFYVPKEQFAEWQKKDPIARAEKFLLDKKYMTATENEALKQRVAKDMEEAEEFALNAPFPAMDEAATGVYAD
ncbi:MAG TPA: thiamine pyrophosphate-dependent dehydrogenase E1 component subunit alpha [bacterium]|nr:thiamine pyrophosphate-dependent dehydrogenase E1 component subunit alpha [bacterium]HMW35181.1 thiamine pyrophosphate-dependent dehydrogenase E1 component subunit alpha [bacterium]HMY36226.1 thiamine pyrophosphate-dependent dehydrogenase E1 component subunit alpha [bacterium]HMZ03846.1 thiamine pyrophosphate-dependent dehydrogenase E1 component subunit alpha [bacterium]HNB10502.1 thiamine pyrophosphate-dependent dehydrogenase E1 component subunit alpha [bacterium]